MKKVVSLLLAVTMVLTCAAGCSQLTQPEFKIVGVWRDQDGYMIQFKDDGSMRESDYTVDLDYRVNGDQLNYMWPDGYIRQTTVTFGIDGTLHMQFNGKSRVFNRTDGTVYVRDWDADKVDNAAQLVGKYTLKSDVGLRSQLHLLDNHQFSLSLTTSAEPLSRWKTAYVAGPESEVEGETEAEVGAEVGSEADVNGGTATVTSGEADVPTTPSTGEADTESSDSAWNPTPVEQEQGDTGSTVVAPSETIIPKKPVVAEGDGSTTKVKEEVDLKELAKWLESDSEEEQTTIPDSPVPQAAEPRDVSVSAEDDLMADSVQLGMYANAGMGDNLYLYTDNATSCEVFRQSPHGTYVALYPFNGEVATVADSYANPVEQRGYCISGSFTDGATRTTYVFAVDNTMVKTLQTGDQIHYGYFLDNEGLITLTCLDGLTDKDFMWFDKETGGVYRMVFERDSWTEYLRIMADNAQVQTLSAQSDTSLLSTEDSLGDGSVEDRIVEDADGLVHLPCQPKMFASKLYKMAMQGDVQVQAEDLNACRAQQAELEYARMTQADIESRRRAEVELFLSQMARITAQNKAAEEARKAEEEAERLRNQQNYGLGGWSGYYTNISGGQEQGTYFPIGGTTGSGTPTAPTGTFTVRPTEDIPHEQMPTYGQSAQSNFGTVASKPSVPVEPEPEPAVQPEPEAEKPVDQKPVFGTGTASVAQLSGKAKVQWVCNCDECHNKDYPIARGATMLCLVDTSVWAPGVTLRIGDGLYSARTVDSQGMTSGSDIMVFSTDHDWIKSQSNGTFTVTQ